MIDSNHIAWLYKREAFLIILSSDRNRGYFPVRAGLVGQTGEAQTQLQASFDIFVHTPVPLRLSSHICLLLRVSD